MTILSSGAGSPGEQRAEEAQADTEVTGRRELVRFPCSPGTQVTAGPHQPGRAQSRLSAGCPGPGRSVCDASGLDRVVAEASALPLSFRFCVCALSGHQGSYALEPGFIGAGPDG